MKYRQIPYKVMLIVVLSIIMFHTIATFLYYIMAKEVIMNSIKTESEYLVRPVTLPLNSKIGNSLTGFENSNQQGLLELFADRVPINFEQISDDVEYLDILLLTNENRIIAHSNNQLVGTVVPVEYLSDAAVFQKTAVHRNNSVIINIPYVYNERILGNFVFVYSDEILTKETHQLLLNSLILLLIFLLISCLIAFYFSRNLTQRLLNTSVKVKEMVSSINTTLQKTNTDKNVELDVIDRMNVNLGKMKSAIIQKIDALEWRHDELKQQNTKLKKDVEKEINEINRKTSIIDKNVRDIAGMISYPIPALNDTDNSGKNKNKFLTISKDKEIHSIELSQISCIKIYEHLYVVYYKENGTWKHVDSFGTLSLFEKEYRGFFIRINRSVLINPDRIENLTRDKNVIYVKMPAPDDIFRVSRARKNMLLKHSGVKL